MEESSHGPVSGILPQQDIPYCEHRSVDKGRTFCGLAVHGDSRSTDEVYAETCLACPVARTRQRHPCAHLDMGLLLGAHRERSSVDRCYYACKAKGIRLPDGAPECDAKCKLFAPLEEKK